MTCCEAGEKRDQDDSNLRSTSETKSTGGGLRKKIRSLLLDRLNLRCLKVIQREPEYILEVQKEVRIQRFILNFLGHSQFHVIVFFSIA